MFFPNEDGTRPWQLISNHVVLNFFSHKNLNFSKSIKNKEIVYYRSINLNSRIHNFESDASVLLITPWRFESDPIDFENLYEVLETWTRATKEFGQFTCVINTIWS